MLLFVREPVIRIETGIEEVETTAQTDSSAREHSLLGLWGGELYQNRNHPQIIDFHIDRNDSESATGSVIKQTGSSNVFECSGATVVLKQQGEDKALIGFDGPTCKGSNVVSLIDDNKLKGKIRIKGRYWTLVFNKSSRQPQ